MASLDMCHEDVHQVPRGAPRGGGRVSHPRDIASAVWDSEADALTRLAQDKVVLEVGAEFGFSTIVLARVAKRVHSVDWFRGDSMAGERDALPVYRDNLRRYGVIDKVVTHIGDAAEVVPLLPCMFDLIFIDAFHEEEAVFADAWRSFPLLKKPDGVMAFHDYGRFTVAPAVDRFALEAFGHGIERVDHLAVASADGHRL